MLWMVARVLLCGCYSIMSGCQVVLWLLKVFWVCCCYNERLLCSSEVIIRVWLPRYPESFYLCCYSVLDGCQDVALYEAPHLTKEKRHTRSLSRAVSVSLARYRSHSVSLARCRSHSVSLARCRSHSVSLARSFGLSRALSVTLGLSRAQFRSLSRAVGHTRSFSRAVSVSLARSRSHSVSLAHFWSLSAFASLSSSEVPHSSAVLKRLIECSEWFLWCCYEVSMDLGDCKSDTRQSFGLQIRFIATLHIQMEHDEML